MAQIGIKKISFHVICAFHAVMGEYRSEKKRFGPLGGKLPLGVNKSVCVCLYGVLWILCVFLSHAQCFLDRLQIHSDPDNCL